MAGQQTQADRIARSLKRLGLQLRRTGRTFRVTDKAGGLTIGSTPAMTIEEIERWIGEHTLCPRGHSFRSGDTDVNVFCFTERRDAEQSQQRFGGEFIDPKDRPKWPGSDSPPPTDRVQSNGYFPSLPRRAGEHIVGKRVSAANPLVVDSSCPARRDWWSQ